MTVHNRDPFGVYGVSKAKSPKKVSLSKTLMPMNDPKKQMPKPMANAAPAAMAGMKGGPANPIKKPMPKQMMAKGLKQVAADTAGITARRYGKATDRLADKSKGASQVFRGAMNDTRKYGKPSWERVGASHQMFRDAKRVDNIGRSRLRMKELQRKAGERGKSYRMVGATGAAAGGSAVAGGAYAKKKLSKGFTLNRKEAKKDALNVGATGAAAGAGLGALSQEPFYRRKGGKMVPVGKFPVKAATKGALAVGSIGAASGVAANLGYKRKKKS